MRGFWRLGLKHARNAKFVYFANMLIAALEGELGFDDHLCIEVSDLQ